MIDNTDEKKTARHILVDSNDCTQNLNSQPILIDIRLQTHQILHPIPIDITDNRYRAARCPSKYETVAAV